MSFCFVHFWNMASWGVQIEEKVFISGWVAHIALWAEMELHWLQEVGILGRFWSDYLKNTKFTPIFIQLITPPRRLYGAYSLFPQYILVSLLATHLREEIQFKVFVHF